MFNSILKGCAPFGLAIVIVLLQSCLNSLNSKESDAIAPGYYKGNPKDRFYTFIYKFDSNGVYESRQYEMDSTTIAQFKGKLRLEPDSVFFSETKIRTFRYNDNSRTLGEWSEWKSREGGAWKRDSVFSDIRESHFSNRLGDEWVLFKKIGSESSLWTSSKNDVPGN